MRKAIRISGKNLGILSLPNCCERCFWLQLKMGFKLPFSIFPGIFSTFDAYTKRVVHGYFDEHGGPPPWLGGIPDVSNYIDPPHWSKFNMTDEKNGILLTGMPDGIFVRRDRSYVIVDYKTAKFTGTQDELFPMYAVQLNAYALIAERCGFKPVTGLALIYFEPVTHSPDGLLSHVFEAGFDLDFSPHILDVPLQPAMVPGLLAQVRRIAGKRRPPAAAQKCRNCTLIDLFQCILENRHSPRRDEASDR